MKKKLTAVMLLVALVLSIGLLTACNKDNKKGNGNDVTLTFAAPEGTPALAIARLITDNKSISGKKMDYKIVNPANIANEMRTENSDIVIMPVNAGAVLINKGAKYKLVSVAVDGSLYLVGKSDTATTLTIDDIKGKKIACIGQQGVPGLVFRYILKMNNIEVVEEKEKLTSENVFVQYVADGNLAKTAVEKEDGVDFAVVGEPAATTFKIKFGFNAQMDLQAEYKKVSGKETYPQAGIFVKSSLASDTAFMDALFAALKASKEWVKNNPQSVNDFMKANAYESAAFPAPSIAKCNVNAEKLTAEKKAEILAFLKNLAPGVNWDTVNLF